MSTAEPLSTEATDMLVFRTGRSSLDFGWSGPWPPPDEMTIVTGPSGLRIACESDKPELVESMSELIVGGYTVEHFLLESASALPEPAPPGEHWCRGAEYRPL